MEMAPSVARKIILEEHAQLRTKLAAVEALIQQKNYDGLKNAMTEFNHFFVKHISTEEKIIRPILKNLDSWGPVRVEKMNKEHAHQIQEIKKIGEMMENAKPAEWVVPLKRFISEIYADIEIEEKEVLCPDLMKDDVITVGGASS